jgi:poly(A) polymerase
MRVGFFVTCLVDLMRPSIGFAAIRLLEAGGAEVFVPPTQTCCGQPGYNSGDRAGAIALAQKLVGEFEACDYLVAPSGSCTGMIKTHYADLFRDDPLRILRAFRIAAELGFSIEAETLKMIRALRHRVRLPAAERKQAELLALLAVPGASAWLRAMDEAGVLTALIEDLEPARRCATVYYGAGGVLEHTLQTAERADFLLHHLKRVFPKLGSAIEAEINRRSRPGAAFAAVVVIAALLHDVSKAETAKRVGGRLRFFGHDAAGARRAAAIMKALRFSREHVDTVSAVVANHLRPGNLASAGVVTEKAAYRFFRDLGENALPLLLVCWADHASYLPEERVLALLAAARLPPDAEAAALSRLPEPERKTIYHLQVVSHLLTRLFDAARKPVPERLLSGNDVMKALNLPPGPEVGKCLERLREAQAEGRVSSRQEALDFLKKGK